MEVSIVGQSHAGAFPGSCGGGTDSLHAGHDRSISRARFMERLHGFSAGAHDGSDARPVFGVASEDDIIMDAALKTAAAEDFAVIVPWLVTSVKCPAM